MICGIYFSIWTDRTKCHNKIEVCIKKFVRTDKRSLVYLFTQLQLVICQPAQHAHAKLPWVWESQRWAEWEHFNTMASFSVKIATLRYGEYTNQGNDPKGENLPYIQSRQHIQRIYIRTTEIQYNYIRLIQTAKKSFSRAYHPTTHKIDIHLNYST